MKSPVAECATASAADHSESRTQLDHATDEVHHQTNVSASSSTSCAVDEVPLVSHVQNDVASQLNNLDNTGDVANSKSPEPTTSCSADSSKHSSVNKPNDAFPYSYDSCNSATADRSSENDTVDQTHIFVDRRYSFTEEVTSSPPRSPSYFSRRTKFLSQNHKHPTPSSTSSSTADSTSKETESPRQQLDDVDVASTFTTAKSGVRKRPAVFVPTPFPHLSLIHI